METNTTNTRSKLEINDEELDSLTNAIKARYGLDFTNYERISLKRGIVRALEKNELTSTMGLWSKIMKEKDFLISCIDDITVNLTEWYRNPEVWIKIKKDLLPKYISKQTINMWHAGCSSGEEAYSMAFILKEANMLNKAATLATDISAKGLERAIKGAYSNISISKFHKNYNQEFKNAKLEDWFQMGKFDSQIKDEIKKNIVFENHNLVQEKMEKKFDIIFCRNVLVYFDDVLKMRALKLFESCLNDGGYFIIGFNDILPAEHKNLFDVFDQSTRIYQKRKI